MRVLINALSARQGGGQTYLKHLLDKFPEGDSVIFIIAPDSLELPRERSNIKKILVPDYLISNPFIRNFWEIFLLPKLIRKLNVDVLFCPGGSVNGHFLGNCKVVTTFQNMMPFDHVQRCKYPIGYMRLRNWLLERKLLKSMIRSDLVIFISQFAEAFIKDRSGGRINSSVVIPHGIDPNFRKIDGVALVPPDWLPSDGYLLYVSILDVYKSQVEVVEAYAQLKSRRKILPRLILIGPEYAPYGLKVREAIAANKLTDDIIVKSAIPNRDLPAVYQNAIVNIFASQTENCPFILLEALAAGRPLLVSTSPPMPEFGGSAVVYFTPSSPSDLAEKLEMVLNDPSLMKELGEKALKQSSGFDWDQAAQRTWQSIEKFCISR